MDTAERSGAIGIAIRRWRRQMEAADFGHTPGMFVLLTGLVFFAWGEICSLFSPTCADTFGTKCAAANAGCSRCRRAHAALMPHSK